MKVHIKIVILGKLINQTLTLIIDISNVNPLVFFQEANFRVDKINTIKMHDENSENNNNRRSLSDKTKKFKWTKTIDLPIDCYNTEQLIL